MKYSLVRSDRKTLSLCIKDGELIVRAPRHASLSDIERFVHSHSDWIEKKMAVSIAQREEASKLLPIGKKELAALYGEARRVIPQRVAYYAPIVGVSYGRVTIRRQKTRWGSCNAEGDLNFNCLLMLTPREVLDSVVVHELCHRKEMNHSKEFYREVYRVFPEYKKWHGWLRQNGGVLMKRVVADDI